MLLNRLNTNGYYHQVNPYQMNNYAEGNTKTRIIVKKGNEYIAMKLDDVMFFYSVDKLVYVYDHSGKKYLFETSLAKLEEFLDPKIFFRANRQYIININYIRSFKPYQKVKLQLFLHIADIPAPIIISQVTATHFRKWIQNV